MNSLTDALFKLDEGILVTVLVAALTPVLAAPAGRLLARGDRVRAARAAKAQVWGDGSNNAAVVQKGNGNTIALDQRHTTTTTTINVASGEPPSSPGAEIVTVIVLGSVTAIGLVVAFLRVGAMPLKVSSAAAVGLGLGVLIHLTRVHARAGYRLKATLLVLAAFALLVSSWLMDGFVIRGASLHTAGSKLHGWDFLASWQSLRKIEQTLGAVFLITTLLGALAVVTVAACLIGTALDHRRTTASMGSERSDSLPRWQRHLTELGPGMPWLAAALAAMVLVLGSGVLVDEIHRDLHSAHRPGGR